MQMADGERECRGPCPVLSPGVVSPRQLKAIACETHAVAGVNGGLQARF